MFGLFRSTKKWEDIDSTEFAAGIEQKDAVILDVRARDEFVSGHIPGAKNIDIMGGNFANQISNLSKEKAYFVYCRSGGRSSSACGAMVSQGFTNLFNLRGGIGSWRGKVVK
jgi:rhodanese-related sulfurtransferase